MLSEEQSRWYRKRTWAELDLDALEHNIRTIRAHLAPGTKLLVAVKANAYGHGDAFIAPYLEQLGVDWFGVSELEEALAMRRYGVCKPVLIFAPVPMEYAPLLAEKEITVAVCSLEYARHLQTCAAAFNQTVNIQIMLDTGMNRVGFSAFEEDAARSIEEICQINESCQNLKITGILTHFSSADDRENIGVAYKEAQFVRFQNVLDALTEKGVNVGIRHCCNSAATLSDPSYHLDMVRMGLITYGYEPGDRGDMLPLLPVMSLHTRIHFLKTIPAGRSISYNMRYTTSAPTTIATLGIGYADGYFRTLTNQPQVLCRGKRVQQVGGICMDQMMVDVTGIDGLACGEEVVLVGTQNGVTITWLELGQACGTIHYEMICAVSRRVPRIYMRGGQDIAVLAYQEEPQFVK